MSSLCHRQEVELLHEGMSQFYADYAPVSSWECVDHQNAVREEQDRQAMVQRRTELALCRSRRSPGRWERPTGLQRKKGPQGNFPFLPLATVRSLPVLGIMIDETSDITVTEKLIIYAKALDMKDGKSKEYFIANCDLRRSPNASPTLFRGQSPAKKSQLITGLGTDGVSVMTGVRNGVGKRLRQRSIHIWSRWEGIFFTELWEILLRLQTACMVWKKYTIGKLLKLLISLFWAYYIKS